MSVQLVSVMNNSHNNDKPNHLQRVRKFLPNNLYNRKLLTRKKSEILHVCMYVCLCSFSVSPTLTNSMSSPQSNFIPFHFFSFFPQEMNCFRVSEKKNFIFLQKKIYLCVVSDST